MEQRKNQTHTHSKVFCVCLELFPPQLVGRIPDEKKERKKDNGEKDIFLVVVVVGGLLSALPCAMTLHVPLSRL